ncbi:MAG: MoxR family ATPase [Gammaproteobacteria bacterium]|jgi:MoxR-like ATPase|nr:MoxR family ATPase [Gammaproteobacteria bacterium]
MDKQTEGAELLQSANDIALAEDLIDRYARLRGELGKLIVGQDAVVEQVMLTILAGGNSLIVGVPGLAKTLLIHSIAQVLDLRFSRIQFTPDLMPSDITGTDLVQENPDTGRRELSFLPGPIFANIVLADEINRTPPKTQSALLEAMQEHRVTVQGKTYQLEEPFFVFATQNPIELEGTYPLPEAQLDRFMFEIAIDYLSAEDELDVVRQTTSLRDIAFEHAMNGTEILAFQRLVRKVPVSTPVSQYALNLVRCSRPGSAEALDFVRDWVDYGASTRAAQYLVLGGKARALLDGRYHVDFDDIAQLAKPVLRHRVLRNFHAEAEKISSDELIERLLDAVPLPSSGM